MLDTMETDACDGLSGLVLVAARPTFNRLADVVRITGLRLATLPELGDFAEVESLVAPDRGEPQQVVSAIADAVGSWSTAAAENVVGVALIGTRREADPVLRLLEDWLPPERRFAGCFLSMDDNQRIVEELIAFVWETREKALRDQPGLLPRDLRDSAHMLRRRAQDCDAVQ
jgi:hypothetical protein